MKHTGYIAYLVNTIALFSMLGGIACSSVSSTPAPAFSGPQATVLHAIDGDHLKIQLENRKYIVRLEGIDAPEMDQPYGIAAQRTLAKLVERKRVQIVGLNPSPLTPERVTARVIVRGKDINEKLLINGLAWILLENTNQRYADIVEEARARRVGVWQDHNSRPPWEHRAMRNATTRKIQARMNKLR